MNGEFHAQIFFYQVVGGEAQGEGARMAAKRDWDVANRARKQGEASLEACAEGCRYVRNKRQDTVSNNITEDTSLRIFYINGGFLIF